MNNTNYFYIHSISYYEGNNRDNNIQFAIDRLKTFKLSILQEEKNLKNLFIVYILTDNNDNVKQEKYSHYESQKNNNLDIKVLYRYNTGGTVQTMYYIYNYLIENKISCDFIGVFEDDAIFKKNYFLDDVDIYLKKDYILTGPLFTKENIYGTKQFEEPFNKRNQFPGSVPFCKKYQIYNNENSDELIDEKLYKWCDGCGYITTIDNLTKIKEKLGKFTLAPETERYTHCEHGINYGEVGFCTRLNINGFDFIGLPASIYYEQLEQNTVGNKNV